jgi:hypothetical protein
MRLKLLFVLLFLIQINSRAQTTIPAGNVSGTWTKAGSPYKVNGNITVPNGQTLTIEPGVRIEFAQFKHLSVDGRILALGKNAASDSIWFTKQNPHDTGSWKGIKFINTPNTNDTSTFQYCVFKHCKSLYDTAWNTVSGGITIRGYGKVKLNYNTFYNNEANLGACIFVTHDAQLVVKSCTFKNNKASHWSYNTGPSSSASYGSQGSAIYVYYNSRVIIDSCTFLKNLVGKNYDPSPSFQLDASVIAVNGSTFYKKDAFLEIKNSVFDGNEGVSMHGADRAKVNVVKCTFVNAPKDKSFKLISNYKSLIRTYSCTFTNNKAISVIYVEGGDFYSNGDVIDHNSNYSGLCISISASFSPPYTEFRNATIVNNDYDPAQRYGGMLTANFLSGCLIANNTAKNLVYVAGAINCTLANNHASEFLFGYDDNLYMQNCIVWGNKSDSSGGRQIMIYKNNNGYFYNNIIEHDTANFWLPSSYVKGLPSIYKDNLATDPLFKNPTAGYGIAYNALNADFGLKSTCNTFSPAINAGHPDTTGFKMSVDLAGNIRCYENRIDIGAYEDNKGSPAITISGQLNRDTLCIDARAARLHLSASGQGLIYQWQQSVNGGGSWTSVPGSLNNDTLLLPGTKPSDNTIYRVLLNGTCDKDTSNITGITTFPKPLVQLGKDTSICSNQILSKSVSETGIYKWQDGHSSTTMTGMIKADNLWWLEITDVNGCKGRDSIYITAKALPAVYLGPDQSIHKLKSIMLDAGPGQASYLWNDALTNQARTFFGKDLGPAGTYLQWVEVTGTNACKARDSINITVIDNTSISRVDKTDLKLYPQPAGDVLHIDGMDIAGIQLFSMQGALIRSIKAEEGMESIVVNDLPGGIYLIELTSKEGLVARLKWLKE